MSKEEIDAKRTLLEYGVRRYDARMWRNVKAQRRLLMTFLSGLFTSKYGDEFLLHYVCPLCGDQLNIARKLNMKASEIKVDFQKDVAGEMINDLRTALIDHYKAECGSDRNRRELTGAILLDKHRDKVYE